MLKNRDFGVPRSVLKLCLVVCATLVLNGCASLTKSDAAPITIWWLEPLTGSEPALSDAAEKAGDINVLVNVTVVPGLNTANILNLSPNAELSHYRGARWAGELPELLNSLVERTLTSRGGYQVVSRRDSRDLNRCVLQFEVKAFYAELNQAGSSEDVHIAFSGEYNCAGAANRLLKVDSRTPVKTNQLSSIVASFQTGLNASLEQLLTQIR